MGARGPEPLPGLVGSGQWSDNVARMHLFMQRHPEVKITAPHESGGNGKDFTAVWPDGELSDRSLGWLMDKMEELFRAAGS